MTFFWLVVTTFFETGLGVSTYLVYLKVIPYLRAKAVLLDVPQGVIPHNAISRMIVPVLYKVPNRWWIRLLALQACAFVLIFTVAEQIFLSVGWRDPFTFTQPFNGLPSMAGWFYDLVFARSNPTPNSAHLMSFVGIPVLGLYTVWKTKDLFLGLLVGALLVAVHEGVWEPLYYLAYSQYLGWDELTNVLKDVSFASMLILFALSYWKYQSPSKVPLREFKAPILIFLAMMAAWFVVPSLYGYGIFPITTINQWNITIAHGIYSETRWWADPTVNVIEGLYSWFGLFLMMLYKVWRWKPASSL